MVAPYYAHLAAIRHNRGDIVCVKRGRAGNNEGRTPRRITRGAAVEIHLLILGIRDPEFTSGIFI